MSELPPIARLKEEARARRRETKKSEKKHRRWERECFWTPPFGHMWMPSGWHEKRCEVCGTARYVAPPIL